MITNPSLLFCSFDGFKQLKQLRVPKINTVRMSTRELKEKPADTDPLLAGVSRAIQQRREEIGLSQEEVAHRAGLHRTYISDIERGARNPSLKTLARLSEALEVPTSTLIKRGEDHMPGRHATAVFTPVNHDGNNNNAAEV